MSERDRVEKLITVLGGKYFQPIADLAERLRTRTIPDSGNTLKAERGENGYAASVCILAVIAFESFLMRIRYVKRSVGDKDKDKQSAFKIFTTRYPDYPKLQEVKEAIVVRDLLAHNHLWEVDYKWTEDNLPELIKALPVFGGDNKYTAVVDFSKRCTKKLRLHVLPNQVDRRDAASVLITVWQALEYLENDDPTACPVSQSFVHLAGKSVKFATFVKDFYNAT